MKCVICNSSMQSLYKDLWDDRYGAPGKYTIYQCVSCGFGQTSPKLSPKNIGEFYARYYPLSLLTPDQVRAQQYLPTKLQGWVRGNNNTTHWHIKPQTAVLDVGSASGVSLLEIQSLGAKAYGVEPDPNSVRLAKELHLQVHQGFIYDLPFPKIKFDFITASQVLEHEPNIDKFVIALKEKLTSKGTIILAYPNKDSVYRYLFKKRWLHWHVPYHINFFTKKSQALFFKKHGLKIIRQQTITPNLWTLLQLRMLLYPNTYNQPNPLWGGATKKEVIKTESRSGMEVLLLLMISVAEILVIPLNRLIDFLGQGESFLVFLQKENR